MTIIKQIRRISFGEGDIRYRLVITEGGLLKDMRTCEQAPAVEQLIRADRLPVLPLEWVRYQLGVEVD